MKKIFFSFLLLGIFPLIYGQESITVLSESSGNSYETARNNALRNAVEKVYGTFVSTSTVVSNNKLMKDEIYTFSSGAVSNFEEISSVVVNGKHSVTLKVTVSREKMATLIRSKGKDIEYDASQFVSGIKAKVINEKLTEESEVNIVSSLMQFAQRVFPDCIDYEVKASEPYLGIIYGWSIKLDLKFTTNKNLDLLNQHIHKTLKALDYNYVDQPKKDWGFNFYTSDKYPEVGEVLPGSPAAIGQLKRKDKLLAYRIGEMGEYQSLKGKAKELGNYLAEAEKLNQPISFELESEERIVNQRKGTVSYEYGEKKQLTIKPGYYAVRVRRTHDDREDLGQATFAVNYNGNQYELRSNYSRTLLHEFVSNFTWRTITSYQVEMDAGKFTKRINLRPVYASRNSDFRSNNPQYCVFTYNYDARVGNPALNLKEYSGIDAEDSPPSGAIYIKRALEYYVSQDEVTNLRLNYLTALFSCTVEYSENKDASLDFISSIKGFKVIKP